MTGQPPAGGGFTATAGSAGFRGAGGLRGGSGREPPRRE
jgi:hypothetical protein